MLAMIQRFVGFFFLFGVSRQIKNWGWTNQGSAFVALSIGFVILICIIYLVGLALLGANNSRLKQIRLIEIINSVVSIIIIYSASRMATNIFGIEFTTSYQLMVFGRCLCAFTEKGK